MKTVGIDQEGRKEGKGLNLEARKHEEVGSIRKGGRKRIESGSQKAMKRLDELGKQEGRKGKGVNLEGRTKISPFLFSYFPYSSPSFGSERMRSLIDKHTG
ncbi:MAG TPA: hypothetical protein VLO30_09985 [Chthoniobacterales bacterium]|nr:hypothetical protein [Chthoniobacterales bacterium]